MRSVEIQAWGLRIVDQVVAHRRAEDAQVECKGAWIDEVKAARQIAALCNASRGAPVLWVVGLDETQGVVAVEPSEFADWWSRVRACFDGPAPAVHDVVVETPHGHVVLLQFDTDRAPFVVKNPAFGTPGGGAVAREVPWREANATRSATHEDLIRMLLPLQHVPQAEVLDSTLRVFPLKEGSGCAWSLDIDAYLTHPVGQQFVIPFHQCEGTIVLDAVSFSMPVAIQCRPGRLSRHSMLRQPSDERVRTIDLGVDQLIVSGPGYVGVHAYEPEPQGDPDRPFHLADVAHVDVTLFAAGASIPVRMSLTLRWADEAASGAVAGWRLASA